MQKIILVIAATLLLVGCASVQDNADTTGDNVDTAKQMTTAEINAEMSASDRDKLNDLIATAKPEDKIIWTGNDSRKFTFTSDGIKLNANGQPCRQYELSVAGTFSTKQMQGLACRSLESDEWRRKS